MPAKSHKVFVGDSKCSDAFMSKVKANQEIPITPERAELISEVICEHFSIMKPMIFFTGTYYPWRRGTYYHFHRRILLHKKGENLSTFLHELAHHVQRNYLKDLGRRHHSDKFVIAFEKVVSLYENYLA